jgi:rhamnosyltransferase
LTTTKHDANICAVIVSYHPDLKVLKSVVTATHRQVQQIVMVDNNSTAETVSCLRGLATEIGAYLIACQRNIGVAQGHNVGIEWARHHGYSHVMLMDQDSIPAPDMVERLSRALASLSRNGIRVAGVGPQYVDAYTGNVSPFVRFGKLKPKRVHCSPDRSDEFVEMDFLITSGSLIPLQIFDEIGLMDAGLFIDHVDTEWVLRAKYSGHKVFGVCGATMRHSLGSATLRFWFFRWRNVPLHSPERHYYIFRNSIALFRRSYAPRQWIINYIVVLVYMSVFFPLFGPHRLRRIQLMLKGIWHGVLGVQGPLR